MTAEVNTRLSKAEEVGDTTGMKHRFDGSIPVRDISDAVLDGLIVDMNRKGYGVIENYLASAELTRMRDFIASKVPVGQGYVGFVGQEAVTGSIFAMLSETPAFKALMRRVYENGTGRKASDAPFYQVLRCLTGQSGVAHSLIFHYDSYVVTALVPVEIPQTGQTGDLIMLPNTRKIRPFYLLNVIDKIMLDNKITQGLLGMLHKIGKLPAVRIKMTPGNIYFFWGYRSIHANEACDPTQIRATAIYHFLNPHAHSSFGQTFRKLLPR